MIELILDESFRIYMDKKDFITILTTLKESLDWDAQNLNTLLTGQ